MEVDFATKLQLVTEYYQGYNTVWDKIDITGLSPQQINAMYDSLPAASYTIDRTPSGLILGRNYANPFELPVTPGTDFDSNIPGGSYGGGNTFTGNVPANLELDPNTGLPVRQTAGPTASGGTVLPAVVDRVSLAVTGVNIGARLGMAIDNALYNLNPSWWDANLPAINPQTWNTLVGVNPVGDFFLRTLFGITGNNMTGYISDDVLAYYYQMLRDMGAFNTGGKNITVTDPKDPKSNATLSNVPRPANNISFLSKGNNEPEIALHYGNFGTAEVVFCFKESGNDMAWIAFSHNPFTYTGTLNSNANNPSTGNAIQTYYVSGKTFYYYRVVTYNNNYNPRPITVIDGYNDFSLSECMSNNSGTIDKVGHIIMYQSEITESPATPGISPLTGATQYPPTNITGSTPQQVKQQLQQEYPDLFNDAITERTLQEDGTVTETTYIPIPWVTEGLNPQQPTTLDDRGQDDTDIDPTTGQQILPTTPKDDPTQPPATGEGDAPIPVPPTGSASSLWAVYNPSQSELNSFGAWLWSSSFVEQIKKLFADPMQAIIGVHKVFVNPPISGSATIKCGYLDSGVSAAVVSNQYTTLNCGSANVREYFGNVFDYDPHTKISLFLPFIGIVPLNVADVMRGTVSVKYTVDVITGACLAEVSVSRDNAGGILYTYGGSCIVSYPVSSGSYAGVISAAISTAIGVGLGLASGGASLPISLGMVARGALNAKTQVQHSGQFSGAAGVMGGKKPYLIVSRPQTRVAANVEDYAGIPSNSTIRIGDCVGFTKLSNVHLIVSNAYDNEIAEIETALKEGVII